MNSEKLSKIKKIELRTAWKHEALDFTNWLAKDENIAELSDEIGINIKVTQKEAKVGTFSLDILAEEETTGRKIIIENQLEITDHEHLGKILTYASGYDAEIIIWIVKNIRDEHKKAIDWLNEHTDENINFFIVKMELWQIDNSPYAPKFNLVAKPNDWAKALKSVNMSALTESSMEKIEFLNGFINYCKEMNSNLRLGNPQPSTPSYYTISIGNSLAWIAVKLNSRRNVLAVDLYVTNKDAFNILSLYKDEIHKEYGAELRWDSMPNYKGAVVSEERSFEINKSENWKKYYDEIKQISEKYQIIFGKYLKIVQKSMEKGNKNDN